MQKELITDKNRAFLLKEFGKTFEEVEAMSEEELDDFTTQLAFAEADETSDETTERETLIGEIIDIICGPYDDDDEGDDDDE